MVAQRGGGGGGFARSLHLESLETPVCVVGVCGDDETAARQAVDEGLSAFGFREVRFDRNGGRFEPLLAPLTGSAPDPPDLGASDVLVVTGGGKGIAAECALALARARGVKLGLIGRADPATDATLSANLERFAAHGVTFHYAAADVCDADGLARAVREIEAALGRVTAVLHGAGANAPRPLSALEPGDFRRTVAPKVAGARNLAAAVDPARLKLFAATGSIIARTGMRGEADYAAANEWLADWMRDLQSRHPACRCRVVEWSVWSGVGMGERLGRVDALEREGVMPIPADTGVRSLMQAIDATLEDPVVVVAGRFGAPPTVTLEERALPLLRFLEEPRVHYPSIEIVADAALTTDADPYLSGHVFRGEPLLPAVLGLEAMAQAAAALSGASGPPVFEEVAFERPVVVPRGGSETVRVAALARGDAAVDVALRSGAAGFQADCFRARCRPGSDAAPEAVALECAPPSERLPLDPDRDLYGSVLFQSDRFRRITGYRRLRATECEAEIGARTAAQWFGAYLPQTLLLGDPGARDAALHAIQACIPHRILLPIAVERIESGFLHADRPMVVRARERSRDGDTFVYDVSIGEQDGTVVERWSGLSLRAVTDIPAPAVWSEPLLATYIERRLGELAPDSALHVAADLARNEGDGGRAIARLLPPATPLLRRPDGKPEVPGSGAVSAAHANGTVFAVSGRGVVGCDVEEVTALPDGRWDALLGDERLRLAETVAREAGERVETARTRAWAVLECLKKAGLPLQTPVQLATVTPDGWVLFRAGSAMVATFVASTFGGSAPMAFAVLAEGARARV